MGVQESKDIMAANIKRYMERKGVTNQQLCDALGFKYTTFIDWINAVTYPRIGKVEAMADYFGCEKSDLIEKQKSPGEEAPTEGKKINIVRIAGRDGSFLEKKLTDEQIAALKVMISQLPEAEEI